MKTPALLEPNATGSDWLEATENERALYCSLVAKSAVGTDKLKLLKAGLESFFAEPKLTHHRVAFAAGNILTSIQKFGDWKPIVSAFRTS